MQKLLMPIILFLNLVLLHAQEFKFVSENGFETASVKKQKVNDSNTNVIGHELGHGAFNLRHTFSGEARYHFPERTTQNLMDYANGEEIWNYQWDLIHDPEKVVLAMLQDEKEGAAAALASPAQNINRLIELIRCSYKSSSGFSFPTPAHWLLHRDQYLEDVELKNGKTYRLAVKFEKDILNYRTKKATAKAENGFAWYPFDGFRIGVKEGQQESFEQYLFPNTGTWESQLSGGAQLIEGLVSSRKVDEAVDMLYETSNCVLSALAYQTKFKLLENIANRFYQEDRKDYGVVELLTSIARSKTESTQFYEDVKSSPEIVTSLYIGTDDEYTTQKYINCLVVIFANYWDGQEIKVSEEKHFLKYSNGLHTAKSPNVSSGDKKLSFTKWKVDFQSWADAVACNPMEPVGILHATTQNEGEDVIKYVPAMYLLHVDKEKRDQNTIEFVAGAANIAATFTGAGLVYKGTSAIQKTIGVIELVNAATTLVLMNGDIKKQIGATPQGIAFLEAWPTISITADLTTLGVASLNAFSKNGKLVLDTYGDIIPDLERRRIRMLVDECQIAVTPSKWFDDFVSSTKIHLKRTNNNEILSKAKQWQGKGDYPGVDEWEVFEIPAGTKIYGGLPGQSEFYSTMDNLVSANYNKFKYWESLQVIPNKKFGYRSKVGEYIIKENIEVAISKTLANPQISKGGGWQIFVDDFTNVLEFVREIQLK